MVQQTASQKSGRRRQFVADLFESQGDKREKGKEVDFLVKDSAMFMRLAANLSSHSKWIPYPFLVSRLRRIADVLRGFADILRGKILQIGGADPVIGGQVSFEGTRSVSDNGDRENAGPDRVEEKELPPSNGWDLSKQNVKLLVKDMEAHASCFENLERQRYRIKDPEIARLIELMIPDMQTQKDELIDIIMRIA
jgi:hypothetical protein